MADKTLFDALASIGAVMDPHWNGEFDGPIMFYDETAMSRLLMVLIADHDECEKWQEDNPNHTAEDLKDFARQMLVKMSERSINMEDYE